MDPLSSSLFGWRKTIVYDRKFPAGTVFFSHTNQPAVLLHEKATNQPSLPNRLMEDGGRLAVGRVEERRAGIVAVDHAAVSSENSAASGEWRWGDRRQAAAPGAT